MNLRQICRRACGATVLAAVVLCGAASALPAQQGADSTRASTANAAADSASNAAASGPRYAPKFQASRPVLARSTVLGSSPAPVDGGQNTIAISTLGLVLILVIVVLLLR